MRKTGSKQHVSLCLCVCECLYMCVCACTYIDTHIAASAWLTLASIPVLEKLPAFARSLRTAQMVKQKILEARKKGEHRCSNGSVCRDYALMLHVYCNFMCARIPPEEGMQCNLCCLYTNMHHMLERCVYASYCVVVRLCKLRSHP